MSLSYLQFGASSLHGALTGAKERFPVEEVASKYNNGSRAGCAISGNLYDALKMYYNNAPGLRRFYLGKFHGGYVVELDSEDGSLTELLKLSIDKQRKVTIHAATVDTATAKAGTVALVSNYKIWERSTNYGFRGTAVLLGIMGWLVEDEEFRERYEAMIPYMAYADDDPHWGEISNGELENLNAFAFDLAKITDNVYRRIQGNGTLARLYLPETNDEILGLTQNELKIKTTPLIGTPLYFATQQVLQGGNVTEFDLGAKLSKEERRKVPQFDKSVVFPEWVRTTAMYIKGSSKYAEPIRTCYFVGPAGCGKTVGSTMLANMLGIPYDHITCHPDMEIFDFLGQIFPNTSPRTRITFGDVREEMGLPTIEEVTMDPESSYIRIFREEMPAGTETVDIIDALVNKVNAEVSERLATKDYTYVEGVLTKAIRNGWLCEVQEIGIVKRPGVAVGLNALLETGENNFIQLPTGEHIEKHPNTVIVFTSNDEYEGTCNLNQSVLSRMGHVLYFQNATVDEMVKRTISKVPDFYSKSELKKMAKIIENINNYCHEQGIDDGVCGQRELNNWAIQIMCQLEDYGLTEATPEIIRETCQTAVLNKVAQNEEDIIAVATACVTQEYGELDVRI